MWLIGTWALRYTFSYAYTKYILETGSGSGSKFNLTSAECCLGTREPLRSLKNLDYTQLPLFPLIWCFLSLKEWDLSTIQYMYIFFNCDVTVIFDYDLWLWHVSQPKPFVIAQFVWKWNEMGNGMNSYSYSYPSVLLLFPVCPCREMSECP
jgi:hypothetical protein